MDFLKHRGPTHVQMHWLLLTVLSFVVVVSVEAARVNQCGGARLLWNENQLGELCETNLRGECPFGRFACISENAIQCVPQCDVTLQDILSSASKPSCDNNGTLTCSCQLGYTGTRCEISDPCTTVNCGNNGRCEKGVCVCNSKFSGDRCQVNLNCAERGFLWNGQTCSCSPGYIGPLCNQCDPFIVCMPRNTSNDFTLARIEDETIIDELLNADRLPHYLHKPYRPIAQSSNGCTCKSASSSGSLIEHYNDDDDNDSLFIHHYYQSTRTQSTSVWPWIAASFIIVLAIMTFVVCYGVKSIHRNSTLLNHRQPKGDLPPPPITPIFRPIPEQQPKNTSSGPINMVWYG